jgi:hypothetical protein
MGISYVRYVDKVPEVGAVADYPGCFISGDAFVDAGEEIVVAWAEDDGWP